MHLEMMRDQAKKFPTIENAVDITRLKIWFCKFSDLSPIAQFSNVRELEIAGVPNESLDFLKALPRLGVLKIIHMPKIRQLDALASLDELVCLSLSTSPSWDASRKFLRVESLEPISKISRLRHLELFGVCPVDKSLKSLEACEGLLSARFSQYPQKEIERFYREKNVSNEFVPTSCGTLLR